MGLCGAQIVMNTLSDGSKVVGLCTARALHDGNHSPEERLAVVLVDYMKLLPERRWRPAA